MAKGRKMGTHRVKVPKGGNFNHNKLVHVKPKRTSLGTSTPFGRYVESHRGR